MALETLGGGPVSGKEVEKFSWKDEREVRSAHNESLIVDTELVDETEIDDAAEAPDNSEALFTPARRNGSEARDAHADFVQAAVADGSLLDGRYHRAEAYRRGSVLNDLRRGTRNGAAQVEREAFQPEDNGPEAAIVETAERPSAARTEVTVEAPDDDRPASGRRRRTGGRHRAGSGIPFSQIAENLAAEAAAETAGRHRLIEADDDAESAPRRFTPIISTENVQRPWPREVEWQAAARNQMDAEQARDAAAETAQAEQAAAYETYQENIDTTAEREAFEAEADDDHAEALQMNEKFDRKTARREARRVLGRRILAAVSDAAAHSATVGNEIAGRMAANAQERAARREDARQENEAAKRNRAERQQAERDAADLRELGEAYLRERVRTRGDSREARYDAMEVEAARERADRKRAAAEARKAIRQQAYTELKADAREVVGSIANRIVTSKLGRSARAVWAGLKASKATAVAHMASSAPSASGRHNDSGGRHRA